MTPTQRLDATFAALADPTRRVILARLATGAASVNELAEPFRISQPAISRHLKVVERAGPVPPGRTLSTCEIDPRVGGKFRNVFTQPGQPGFEVRGTFREVKAPERWVHTEEYAAAGAPETTGGDEPAVETMVLTEKAGRTTLT